MKISVMGTGYVGLVSGTCLAERGHQVTCIDIRSEVVQEINAGRPPIHEIGLDNLLRSARDKGMLSATTDAKTAILDSDVTLICVGTPTVDGRMDMSQIVAAAKEIGSALASKRGYHVVAVKSTVLPGTTEGPVKAAIESHSGKKVGDGWGFAYIGSGIENLGLVHESGVFEGRSCRRGLSCSGPHCGRCHRLHDRRGVSKRLCRFHLS